MAKNKDKDKEKTSEFDELFQYNDSFIEAKKSVTKIEEYTRLIRVLTDYWGMRNAWFRGHTKEKYKLTPSAYRPDIWNYDNQVEADSENEFIRQARAFSDNNDKNLNRWEWYQIMQHHGMPTRLLDWSSASNVALYFALRNLNSIENPTVWAIDPEWLNRHTTGDPSLLYTDPSIQTDEDIKITGSYVPTSKVLPELPAAILPAHIVPRITAQHGCFTIHGRNKKELFDQIETNGLPRIAKIVINDKYVEAIKGDLAINGIIETSLFPDLDGLARHLKWENDMT